jgi:F-type H+-transporting ATPase subunit delta
MADREKIRTRPASVLEDPSAQTIARTYADALLEAAKDQGGGAEVLDEMDAFIEQILEKHPEFNDILLSSIVSRDDKVALIDRAIAPHTSEIQANFLRVLAQHDRLEILPLIVSEARVKFEKGAGKQRVGVTSAIPLSDSARKKVYDQLNAALPFDPIVEEIVDPSLLGGLIIRIGDTIHDSSLRTRMKQLRSSLQERTLNEIQSGRDRFGHN